MLTSHFRLSRWDGERATFEGEAYCVDGADAASSRSFDDGSQVCVEGNVAQPNITAFFTGDYIGMHTSISKERSPDTRVNAT